MVRKKQLRQESLIRVPEEISIMGFDHIVFSNYTNPPKNPFDQPKRSSDKKRQS